MKTKTAKATTSKKPSTKKAGAKKGAGKSEETPAEVVEEVTAQAATEIPVEDEQLAGTGKAAKGRNNDKYKIAGDTQVYGKGRIIQAAVRKYVAEHPKVTYKQLKEVFPDELLARFGVFQDENGANNLASAGRQRYFMGENDGIKLGDKRVVFTCSQLTAKNIVPIIEACKKAGIKISVAAK
jgi:hypothetical protein